MISALRYVAVISAAVVLNACAGIPVSTDYDPHWQVPADPVYAWMPHPMNAADTLVDNDLVAARIHRAVNQQLEDRGFRRAKTEADANVLVAYHIGQQEKLSVSSFHSHFGYYPCWHCWGPDFDDDPWITQYTQGNLVVDLVDAKTKKLVWRGIASRPVPSLKTPRERDRYIRENVEAIFKKFPH